MELPEDVLVNIKEYSMPLTRPDWRTLHKMPYTVYKKEFSKVYLIRWLKIQQNTNYKPIFENYFKIFGWRWYQTD